MGQEAKGTPPAPEMITVGVFHSTKGTSKPEMNFELICREHLMLKSCSHGLITAACAKVGTKQSKPSMAHI
jgi:hypothetical protein